ncbi:hypothetical protein J2X69_004381 [Algoriphagus sp. 4150]|nr:hypothetical protein [Algoriphagus sp. 4150]
MIGNLDGGEVLSIHRPPSDNIPYTKIENRQVDQFGFII